MTTEPFINARAAARFVGFEPGEGPAGRDPAMRAFYEWVRVARVPKYYRGPRVLLFRVSELEAVIANTAVAPPASGEVDATDTLTRMQKLAREHVLQVTKKKAG